MRVSVWPFLRILSCELAISTYNKNHAIREIDSSILVSAHGILTQALQAASKRLASVQDRRLMQSLSTDELEANVSSSSREIGALLSGTANEFEKHCKILEIQFSSWHVLLTLAKLVELYVNCVLLTLLVPLHGYIFQFPFVCHSTVCLFRSSFFHPLSFCNLQDDKPSTNSLPSLTAALACNGVTVLNKSLLDLDQTALGG